MPHATVDSLSYNSSFQRERHISSQVPPSGWQNTASALPLGCVGGRLGLMDLHDMYPNIPCYKHTTVSPLRNWGQVLRGIPLWYVTNFSLYFLILTWPTSGLSPCTGQNSSINSVEKQSCITMAKHLTPWSDLLFQINNRETSMNLVS
jgi:hypothetical protein